jgi:2,3-bisphosphoglycerate-dependent phosphoglycerate mutase
MHMTKLILMRHGQSQWNLANLFTGWVDIPLSTQGVEEALQGGDKIKDLPIDIIFTSSLIRAQMTAMLAMTRHHSGKVPLVLHPGEGKLEEWAQIYSEEAKAATIPVIRAWELNERMYGTKPKQWKDMGRNRFKSGGAALMSRRLKVKVLP